MLSSVGNKNVLCELQAEFIQNRVGAVEKNFVHLCHSFSDYTRKAARLRDKGDELAKVFMTYSKSEQINKSLSEGLGNFAAILTAVDDYGDSRVLAIDKKVIEELCRYREFCKTTKEDARHIFAARDREVRAKKSLERVREKKPRNRQEILELEEHMTKVSAEVASTACSLEEQTIIFEKRKLCDLKKVMLDFITVEIAYHAKVLSVLSKGYESISAIDEEKDLEEFRKVLHKPENLVPTRHFQFPISRSLGSLNTLFITPSRKHLPKILADETTLISKSSDNIDTLQTISDESTNDGSSNSSDNTEESSSGHEM